MFCAISYLAKDMKTYQFILRFFIVPTWSEWKVEKCSAKCRGGSRTLMRYCYNHLPCVGEGSKAERCNTEGCPGYLNSIYINISMCIVYSR